MPPRSAPSSLADIRLERLRRLKELKAAKAARDVEEVQSIATRFPMPGDLAKLIDPTTVRTPALNLLDQNLLEVAEGICERLIFSLPPQEGKASGSRATSHCGCCCEILNCASSSLPTSWEWLAAGREPSVMTSLTILSWG